MRKHGYAIVLEDSENLHRNMNKNKNTIAWEPAMFAYRKLQKSIVSKAIEYNVPVIFVNPKNSSSVCPRYRGKLTYSHRLTTCPRCGLIADRDKVGVMNIWFKAFEAYVAGSGCPPNALAMNYGTRGSGRTEDEGMM